MRHLGAELSGITNFVAGGTSIGLNCEIWLWPFSMGKASFCPHNIVIDSLGVLHHGPKSYLFPSSPPLRKVKRERKKERKLEETNKTEMKIHLVSSFYSLEHGQTQWVISEIQPNLSFPHSSQKPSIVKRYSSASLSHFLRGLFSDLSRLLLFLFVLLLFFFGGVEMAIVRVIGLPKGLPSPSLSIACLQSLIS